MTLCGFDFESFGKLESLFKPLFDSMMQFGMVVAERLMPGVGERVQQLVPPSVAAPPVAAPPVASPQAARWLSSGLGAASDSSVSESSGVE